ncbi:MAG: crossover junction endodeoxyribonuclease RuvC [Trueperaceae bacterium]
MLARKPQVMKAKPTALNVVGIDPGIANLGIGAIRQEGTKAQLLNCQLIRTPSSEDPSLRLLAIYTEVKGFLQTHKPEALALESQYFHQQKEVAFKVGQAVGVCLLAAGELDIPVFEYGPMQVKQALVGTGKADKVQVAFMVRALLNLTKPLESHHVADALAIALTHLSFHKIQKMASL